jgi:hypothetical protein
MLMGCEGDFLLTHMNRVVSSKRGLYPIRGMKGNSDPYPLPRMAILTKCKRVLGFEFFFYYIHIKKFSFILLAECFSSTVLRGFKNPILVVSRSTKG